MTDAAATSANGSQTAAGNGGAGATGGAAATGAAASGTDTGNAAQQNQNANGAQSGQPASAAAGTDPYASLKAPEGFDPAALPKIAEIAKVYGLNAEAAQKLLNDTHTRQVQAKADMDAALAKQKAEWHEAIKADKDYGGEKFEASLQRAQKVVGEIDAKIAPGIKQLLDGSGYGEHPAVVRLFNYLGQANREDSFAAGGDNSAGEKPIEDVLYPKAKTSAA